MALAAILLGSGLATVTGLFALIRFDGEAGAQESAPLEWPAVSAVAHSSRQPTLLVFAHPECPCTRATLDELSRAISDVAESLHPPVEVLFVRVPGQKQSDGGESWRIAQEMGAAVAWDDGATEAAHFRAKTSGFIVLYDTHGRLIFQGGITASRGHIGPSYGKDRLEAALRTGVWQGAGSQVFGCSLQMPGRKDDVQ